MKTKYRFERPATKKDVFDIYAQTMANLGPLNILCPKFFQCDVKTYPWKTVGEGMYNTSKFAYLASKLLDLEGLDVNIGEMQRSYLGLNRRNIRLKNTDYTNQVDVQIEGSRPACKKMENVLKQIFEPKKTNT